MPIGASPRKPAERAVDEAAAKLRALRDRCAPAAEIAAAQRRLGRAWANVRRLREGGY